MSFLLSALYHFALLLLVSTPVLFMARRQHRALLFQRFILACALGGVFCGIVAAGSQRLVDQCEAEGNSSCFDAGADGMIMVLVGGFFATSAVWAYLLFTD